MFTQRRSVHRVISLSVRINTFGCLRASSCLGVFVANGYSFPSVLFLHILCGKIVNQRDKERGGKMEFGISINSLLSFFNPIPFTLCPIPSALGVERSAYSPATNSSASAKEKVMPAPATPLIAYTQVSGEKNISVLPSVITG